MPVNTVYRNCRADFIGTRFSWVKHPLEKEASGRCCPLAHLDRRFSEKLRHSLDVQCPYPNLYQDTYDTTYHFP